MKKPDDLVILDVYRDAVTAYMEKGVLAENGVESMVTNELMSSILPLNMALGEVRLLVFRRDLEKAREILAAGVAEEDIATGE